MEGRLILNPSLGASLGGTLRGRGLAAIWAEGDILPGGRGTARVIPVEGIPCIVKREKRGGLGGKFLPDRFLLSAPFLRELELGLALSTVGLAPEPVAVEFSTRLPPWRVYTLSRAVIPGRTLAQMLSDGALDSVALAAAGGAVARLHREGVLHGDLNAGNILQGESGAVFFLDLRHSRRGAGEPPAGARRRNLSRLGRSLHKLSAVRRTPLPSEVFGPLAEGYGRGWGDAEGWLAGFVIAMSKGFPVRRHFW